MQHEYGVTPAVYSGGATVFNDKPFVNYFLQQQAKKQAQDQALDNYYRDQAKSLTPTGMRSKDIEGGFSDKFNKWQQLGVEGKKYLLNPALDGYKTLNEFNRQKNELHSDIEKSKDEAKWENKIGDLKLNGKLNPTQSDNAILMDHSLSIYDPKRQGLSWDDLSVNHPPLDETKYLEGLTNGVKRGTIQDAPIIDRKNGLQTINYKDVYTPNQIKTIADKAALSIEGNQSAQNHFDRLLHSQSLPALQSAFSSVYPNGGVVDSPQKAAQAYAIMNTSQPSNVGSKQEKYTDPKEEENRQIRMENLRFGHEQSNIKLRKQLGLDGAKEVDDAGGLDAYMESMRQAALKNPREYTKADGSKYTQYAIPASEASKKMFAVDTQQEGANGSTKTVSVTPDELRFSADGKYVTPIFYNGEVQKNGKVSVDEKLSKPVLVEEVKARWGKDLVGVKAASKSFGAKSDSDGHSTLTNEPSDWKQEGINYRFKDGRLYDASGKLIKKK